MTDEQKAKRRKYIREYIQRPEVKERRRQYRRTREVRQRRAAYRRKKCAELRARVLEALGGRCEVCGSTKNLAVVYRVLDGSERKDGLNLYRDALRQARPADKYCVLCRPCSHDHHFGPKGRRHISVATQKWLTERHEYALLAVLPKPPGST